MKDRLPDIFTSLSKYHTIESHYDILRKIKSDVRESVLRRNLADPHLLGTARRYLLIRNGVVIRDRLIDFIHAEGKLTQRVKMVMYFLFMFRDARYREFICSDVARGNGRWDTEVFKAKHTSYFPGSGGHKAFTNLRQLLLRTGILDEHTYSVDMGDVAQWLPIGIEVAAQHLDSESRAELVRSPHGFIIRNRLNAIIDRTPEQITEYRLGGTYEDATDLLPEIDVPVRAPRANRELTAFKAWNRSRPPRRSAGEINFTTDPVAYERANYQHWLLERMLAEALRPSGCKLTSNQLIDMLAEQKSAAILLEMKSCTPTSMRSQVRRAISQLLEYRFLYRHKLPEETHLCMVLERRPSGKMQWLLEYADFLGICVIWKRDTEEKLACSPRAYEVLRQFDCHSNFTVGK